MGQSVPTTKVITERDFGMLDRLLRENPNALTIALEGMITSSKYDNQLKKVVYAHLQLPSSRSGCRALGIIDKIIPAPLWKVLNEKDQNGKRVHVASMNARSCFPHKDSQLLH